jgi:putative tricarboxylic transport membrane protein
MAAMTPHRFLFAMALAAACSLAHATGICLIPSKPGGAMDMTCKLARHGLQDGATPPLTLAYLPGGIGAVAWHTMVSQRRAEPDTLVTFSGGSLLNLAQGKFGKATPNDVRWVAALGADYGMIAGRAETQSGGRADRCVRYCRQPGLAQDGAGGAPGRRRSESAALRGAGRWR